MRFILAAAVAVGLAGCATPPYSEAPLATNFPTVTQQQARAAGHWRLIADDLVGQVSPAVDGRPVFVVQPNPASAEFSQAFRQQLVAALATAGSHVAKRPGEGVLNVEVDAQLVHSPGLAAVPDRDGCCDNEYIGGPTPQYELVIALRVTNGTRHIAARSAVYYVSAADRALFVPPPPARSYPAVAVRGGE